MFPVSFYCCMWTVQTADIWWRTNISIEAKVPYQLLEPGYFSTHAQNSGSVVFMAS
jgi:hypothetical protein